ncbi:DUF4252 domain-containing protein [bacterium]|nr:DUF4252 domain-containing protein [bacterium]MBU1674534.1 DUF4252 domain-containing protein [bacterium]
MKTVRVMFAIALLAALLAGGTAAAGDLKNEPGYIDLEWIVIPDDADEIQDIDLGPALISAAADAEAHGDSELYKAFKMIKSIRVKSFTMDDASPEIDKAVDKINKKLKDKDWKRLIYVKDDEEIVTVSTKSVGDDMVGLMVVAYEPGNEVSFVNVVGDLDLAYLISLAGKLHGDSLAAFLEELEDEGMKINVEDD